MNEVILIVDDEPGILTELGNILRDEGYRPLVTESGEEALRLYQMRRPHVVFLDIWLPDKDGLEVLQALRQIDPDAVVVMMSGHGTTPTAVKAIKMGAFEYLEKPLAYSVVMETVQQAVAARKAKPRIDSGVFNLSKLRAEKPREFVSPATFSLLKESREPQRTIKAPAVLYGLGLHSGARTGMALLPLPANSGIHFVTIPKGTQIPAHISAVGDTDYATTLIADGEEIRTVEHFLSTLHARGVTNLLIKVHGEIPVLDGSAIEFCKHIEEIGLEDQGVPRKEVVIDRTYSVGSGEKVLTIEPFDGFAVSYFLRYPPPIGEQFFDFTLANFKAFATEIAPARTFGFMRDLKMLAELGLGSGGRLDNCILVGEDNVINTSLRFPDEFVRHKVLDIIGDLYLLGYPVRGKVTARLTGHRDNIKLQRAILAAVG